MWITAKLTACEARGLAVPNHQRGTAETKWSRPPAVAWVVMMGEARQVRAASLSIQGFDLMFGSHLGGRRFRGVSFLANGAAEPEGVREAALTQP